MTLQQQPIGQVNPALAGKAEVRVFFERTIDMEMLLERVHVSENAPQSQLLDTILYVWGKSPNRDEINFMMAQDAEGSVLVNKPSLLKFVDRYRPHYG